MTALVPRIVPPVTFPAAHMLWVVSEKYGEHKNTGNGGVVDTRPGPDAIWRLAEERMRRVASGLPVVGLTPRKVDYL